MQERCQPGALIKNRSLLSRSIGSQPLATNPGSPLSLTTLTWECLTLSAPPPLELLDFALHLLQRLGQGLDQGTLAFQFGYPPLWSL